VVRSLLYLVLRRVLGLLRWDDRATAVGAYFLHNEDFLNEARSIEGQLYNASTNIITQLNGAIDAAAASQPGVVEFLTSLLILPATTCAPQRVAMCSLRGGP
jgi:hypothetical protein